MAEQQQGKGMSPARRQFLTDTVRTACGVGLVALGLGLYSATPAPSRPRRSGRGALTEHDFLGACVRCGLCVRDCPYDT